MHFTTRIFSLALLLAPAAWAALPIEHWTHDSGARVYLVQSPGIAMVDVQLDFDAGDRRSPESKTGLAGVMASATRNGVKATAGQSALDENALGEAWADLGASFTANAGSDRLTFALRSLSYPDVLAQASALAARQLGEPAFPDKLWQRDRPKMIASIKEANTRPATVAARAFGKAVYGKHPYGRETTEADLRNISSADMQALHAQAVRACYARISMVGAVNRAQADALVATLLARMPQGNCPPLPLVDEVLPLSGPSEQRIAFDSAQAHVLVGQPGIKRNSPDYFALLVGNHIFGRRRVYCTPDRRGARKARPDLWHLQQLCAGPARWSLHHQPANPARPSAASPGYFACRAAALCGRRPHCARAAGGQRQPDRWLCAAH